MHAMILASAKVYHRPGTQSPSAALAQQWVCSNGLCTLLIPCLVIPPLHLLACSAVWTHTDL